MNDLGGFSVTGAFYAGGHHPASLPQQQGDIYPVQSSFKETGGILTLNLAMGVSPFHTGRMAYYATRIWAVFGVAESGADGSNYTTVAFREGASFASYTALGSLTTATNPGAGVPITSNITPKLLDAGRVLFVVLTRTGVGSVNFTAERVTVGVDFQGVRVG